MLKDHRPIRVGPLFLPILTVLFLCHSAPAAVSVGPSLPITHRVVVQPIVVKKTNGVTANYMGDVLSEAYIKGQINLIWAQVGVEIQWLDIVEYTNNFAYDGSPANYTSNSRPTSHLNTIVNSSGTPPKSSDPKVLNVFFVRIPAGFNQLANNYAAGLAFIDRNGSMIYVGSSLLTYNNGRDAAASVIAHEIGHNLGLDHLFYSAGANSNQDNLMYSQRSASDPSGTGDILTSSQSATIFTNNSGTDGYDFLQPISNYLTWAELNSLTEGPDGDDDGDHLSNAFEFLNGTSPTSFTPHPAANVSAQGLTWTLTKNPEAHADGFSYLAESSLTLGNWLPAGTTNSGSSILTDNSNTFSVRLNSGFSKAFLRFDIDIPASAEELESPASFIESAEPETWIISDCHQETVTTEYAESYQNELSTRSESTSAEP